VPYLFLVAAALAMLALAWWRSPGPLCPWSFLTTGGAITLGDLVVTGILAMYQYRPGFLPHYPDNYLGVLIAECLFVPAYYAFLSTFPGRCRYWVYGLGVVPVLLLEVLFLWLGVYVHRTWTLWHSVVLFLLYGLVAAYGANSFERRRYSPHHRFVLVAATMYYIMNLWALIPFGILRLVTIRLHLFESAELDLVISALLLHAAPFTLIGIIGTWYRLTRRLWFLLTTVAGFALWLTFLQAAGIWVGRPPWNPWLEGVCISLSYAGLGWIDHWFAAHARTRPRIPPWVPPDTSAE
jgi:hypothetical protein